MGDDGSIPLQIAAGTNGSLPLQLLIILILTALNAFFAASEIALLSVNDAKMKKLAEKGNKKAALIVSFLENSSKFLSTIQVGVTLSGFLSSAFAADSFSDRIVFWLFSKWPEMQSWEGVIRTVVVILITILLSYFTLVFGELVPKRIAMEKSEKLALASARPLRATGILFSPFIKILTLSVNGMLRLVGINPNESEDDVTEEEILLMVNEGQEKGVIGDEESEMINNILEFNDTTASNIMTHRTEICAISTRESYSEVLEKATEERYSRFPVYEDRIDNIIGIMHIKDLLRVKQAEEFDLRSMTRPPCFVPESQKIDDVLNTLKNNNNHMAVVVDEYGGTAGIVTMEDILEELVGNIRDEYDEEEVVEIEQNIVILDENTYQIAGLTEIDDVNEALEIELPDDEYDTISGFVIGELGGIPDEDSHPVFQYEGLQFQVEKNNEKIITSVKVTKLPKAETEADSEESNTNQSHLDKQKADQ